MSTKDTQIFCWPTTTWTAVVGWFQIIGSVSAAVVSLVVALSLESPAVKGKVDKAARLATRNGCWIMFGISFVSMALGVLLIIGNRRENLKMLWTWVILSVITYGSVFVLGIVEAASPTGSITEASVQFVTAAILGFCVYCIGGRIKDVRMNQRLPGKQDRDCRLESSPLA